MSNGNGKEIVLTIRADGKVAVDQLKAISTELGKTGQAGAGADTALKGVDNTLKIVVEDTRRAARETENLGNSMRKGAKEAEGFLDLWSRYTTPLNQTLGVFREIKAVLDWGYQSAKMGAEIREVRENFTAMARSIGMDGDRMFSKLQSTTKGMISDVGLMKASIKALNKNITEDPAELARLLQISEALADLAVDGRNAEQVFDELLSAISKGTPKALVELGLLPESFKRSTDAAEVLLTRQEMLNVIFEQGAEKIEKVGEAGSSAADNFNQLESSWANLADTITERLVPAFVPIVNNLIRIITLGTKAAALMANIHTLENRYRNPYLGMDASELRDMKAQAQGEISALTPIPGVPSTRKPTSLNPGADIGALKNKVALLEEALRNAKDLDYQKNLKGWEEEIADRERYAIEQAGKSAEESAKGSRKRASENLQAAKKEALEAEKWNKRAVEFYFGKDGAAAGMGGIVDDAVGLASSVDLVTVAFKNMKRAEAEAVSAFKTAIRDQSAAVEAMMGGFVNSTGTADYQLGLMGMVPGMFGVGGKTSSMDTSEIDERNRRDTEEAIQEFREKLKVNVSGAFNEGLYDAMTGGDFFESFGDSLKKQVISAFSNAITGQVFGTGSGAGSFDMGSILFGSGGVGSIVSGGGGGASGGSGGGTGGSGGAGSSGILGGLMGKMFKPIFGANNALNWGALGSNLLTAGVAGFAVNRLFGQGGLFGGSVVHGQDQIQISGDLNSQVAQAQKQREGLLGTVGASSATMQALEEMVFATTGVAKHKSGNGITSKKTVTYEATNVAETQAGLAKFLELSEKITAEAAARQFEIALKQMTNPLEALNMTISDLQAAISSATDEKREELAQQLKMAQTQKDQALSQYQANWFSTRMGTAAASAGSILTPGMEVNGPVAWRNGMWENLPNHINQLDLLKRQGSRDFTLGKMGVAAGDSVTANADYLQARKDYLADSLKTFENLMKDAEARARAAKENTDAAARAVQEFSSAQNAYYGAQLEQLQIEQQLQAAKKAKQEQIRDDILGTMLTHIGEVSELGGKQVIVLSAGQPDARDLAVQIRDTVAGQSPELAKALGDFIDSRGPRWN